jgi:hypothetical protein
MVFRYVKRCRWGFIIFLSSLSIISQIKVLAACCKMLMGTHITCGDWMQTLSWGYPLPSWNFSGCYPLHSCKIEMFSNSRMQISVNIFSFHACIGHHFEIFINVVDSKLKYFRQVVDNHIKGFACGLYWWHVHPLCFCKTAGRNLFKILNWRSLNKIYKPPAVPLLIHLHLTPGETVPLKFGFIYISSTQLC